jgi:hypothetical protein
MATAAAADWRAARPLADDGRWPFITQTAFDCMPSGRKSQKNLSLTILLAIRTAE